MWQVIANPFVCHLFDPGDGEDVLYHGLFFQYNG